MTGSAANGRAAVVGLRWCAALLATLVCLGLTACTGLDERAGAGADARDGVDRSPLPESNEESDARRRARIRLELGASYYQQGNFKVALDELRQAVSADPDYAPAYGMIGLVYMAIGENARADENFLRGLRLAPADSDLNNNYGWFLCQTGKARESLDYFARALRNPLYTTPARPLHNAGICALRLGDTAAAESYFLRSFQVDPSNPVAMFNLAELFLKRGDIERARFYSQRLVANFDPSPEILWLALRIERKAGNRDVQASLESQLRRRFPASGEAAKLAKGEFED